LRSLGAIISREVTAQDTPGGVLRELAPQAR
jgi:hypothetical protein